MASFSHRRWENEHHPVYGDIESGAHHANNAQPPSIFNGTSLEEPGSKIWIPYLDLADRYDKDVVHNWRDDMDALLIFAALFSASVTAFAIESYKNLIQDPGEVTVNVLLHMSQQLANGSYTAAAVRPQFQPASIDIAINVFWFLSLAFSLTCALAAVLVRQWARQYLRFPRSFSSVSERARSRHFLFENMQWWKMDVIVEMIPALLHVSLILFFLGLLLFARVVNLTLAAYLLCFSTVGGVSYITLTTTPLVFPGCPYKTPFTDLVGLCVKGGATLFQFTWRCIVACFGGLIFLIYSVFSLVVHYCFSSTTIPKWSWYMTMSTAIRSITEEIWSQIRNIDISIHSILEVIKSFPPLFKHAVRKVHAFATSPIAIHAVRQLPRHLWKRQQRFQNHLTDRDARALQWTLEFSKRDIESFTIINSVPEFVRLYSSNPEVRLIMWKSGVMSRALRLLRSCGTSGDQVSNQSIYVSCLESIICLTPCSPHTIWSDNIPFEMETVFISDLLLSIIDLRVETEVTQFFECTLSNLVLRRMYVLDAWLRTTDTEADEFQSMYRAQRSSIMDIIRQLQKWLWIRYRPSFDSTRKQLNVLERSFSKMPIIEEELCRELRTFRSHWAASWLKFYISLSPSYHGLIWASLSDATTHLQGFPNSTFSNQCDMFILTDRLLRGISRRKGEVTPDSSESEGATILLNYSRVLYDWELTPLIFKATDPSLRSQLHLDFVRRVHVYGRKGYEPSESGEIVEISHPQYTEILAYVASSYQGNESDAMHGDGLGAVEDSDDADADAIEKIIRCRLHDLTSCPTVSFWVDARHLASARIVRRYAPGMWNSLVERTAKEFGYSFQLEESYNIDVHAELQYYDLGPGILHDFVDEDLPPIISASACVESTSSLEWSPEPVEDDPEL